MDGNVSRPSIYKDSQLLDQKSIPELILVFSPFRQHNNHLTLFQKMGLRSNFKRTKRRLTAFFFTFTFKFLKTLTTDATRRETTSTKVFKIKFLKKILQKVTAEKKLAGKLDEATFARRQVGQN